MRWNSVAIPHSYPDSMKVQEKVKIRLQCEDRLLGNLVIATFGSIDGPLIGCDIGEIIERTGSVVVCREERELISRFSGKDQDPIVILERPSNSHVNLLLLEDARYGLKIESEVPFDIEKSFASLKENGIRVDPAPFAEDGKTFEIQFSGYAGTGYFDIFIDGETVSIPFEVRSSKSNIWSIIQR